MNTPQSQTPATNTPSASTPDQPPTYNSQQAQRWEMCQKRRTRRSAILDLASEVRF